MSWIFTIGKCSITSADVTASKKLSSKGKGNLKLSDQKQDIGAGFILKRGQIKTNVSLTVLLDQARKELEIDLAKELFED